MHDKQKYKKGDVAYMIVSWYDFLVARCEILEVDDYFVKKHGDSAVMYYDVDEPIGSAVHADELYDNLENALHDIKMEYEDSLMYHESEPYEYAEIIDRLRALKNEKDEGRLNKLREDSIHFISNRGKRKETIEYFDKVLKDKKWGEDWWDIYYIYNKGATK